jgi:hypothetical protein
MLKRSCERAFINGILDAMKVEKLSITLQKIINARGLAGRLGIYRIIGQWESTVGAVIARHAQPLSIRGKKLTVQVDSPVWMQQLSLLKPDLIEKVNRGMGEDAVKDITLRLGEVAQKKLSPRTAPPVPLSGKERALVDGYVKDIDDPEIKAALAKLIERDLVNKKGKQTGSRVKGQGSRE